jgi:hypothetical protein
MKFDVVVGNPPYQEDLKDTSDASIYNTFYDLSEKIAEQYILISPARFLFNAGKTPKSWNLKMLNDVHLKVVNYAQDSSIVFANTDIKGGIAIVYRDEKRHLGPIGTFTSFNELNQIVNKVTLSSSFESIVPIIYLQEKLNLSALVSDFPLISNKIGSNGKEKRLTTSIFSNLPEIFSDSKLSKDDIEILGLIKNRRVHKFIKREYLEPHPNLYKWKVILPKSNGSGAIGEVLSTPVIGHPVIGHTQSFISIGKFNSENEANNALNYIKTKFCRTMLGVLKITQDNNPSTWSKVPLQDFTADSDIDWTKSISEIDQQLYKKYDLSDEEITFIEDKVKPMD